MKAAISPIYDLGLTKRKPPKKKNDSSDHSASAYALERTIKWYGAEKEKVNRVRELTRGGTLSMQSEIPGSDLIIALFNKYGRAVQALNKVKTFGEFYILPKRSEPDPHVKITVKKSSRNLKTFVKPGEITGFTITRL